MSTASRRYVERETPLGVKIVSILGVVGSLFAVVLGIGLLAAIPVLGLAVVGLAIAQIVVYVNLWKLRSWAWKWALVLTGLNLVLVLLRRQFVGAIVSLVILGYLVSASDAFKDY